MNLQPDDITFLTGLVKMSRQRIHYIHWVDRDGSNRNTAVTAAELDRINALAKALGVNKADVLRQAAHIPVPKYTSPKPSPGAVKDSPAS